MATMGHTVTGVLKRIDTDSFEGKEGTVQTATAVLDVDRDYPAKVLAVGGGVEAMQAALGGFEGKVVAIQYYPKVSAKGYLTLRYLGTVKG